MRSDVYGPGLPDDGSRAKYEKGCAVCRPSCIVHSALRGQLAALLVSEQSLAHAGLGCSV